ncbi:metallophosphoesterase family protein [Saccharicrinis sp. FJH54]|uniref:metallophosphoesterase family protein n=1 Tax=Saccharicrinis sp. FJH54 TaxID=3344665 RepID=UPI0035D42A3A
MKAHLSTKLFTVITLLLIISHSVLSQNKPFSFVFMTDIHLQPEKHAVEGFEKAITEINDLQPDFVITGGDLIMDALKQSYGRADSLYKLYISVSRELNMPVHNTMGNHEIFGICNTKTDLSQNPEYNEKMFEKRLGDSYYTFRYNGWKFFILNSVEKDDNGCYIGWIDDQQKEWIKKELSKTDKDTPIAITTHIPFITTFNQVYYGSTLGNDSSLVVANSKDILDLFKGHNLKLVMQGDTHIAEDVYIDGIHYITGGAICGAWWNGPNRDTEEGFALFKVDGDRFTWEYVDYGWEVGK